jgi:hypothetical protein
MFDHQHNTFTLLTNLAEESLTLIQKTQLENEIVLHDLFCMDRWLKNYLNHPFPFQLLNGRNYQALEPLLNTVTSMIGYTRDVRKYLGKSRLLLQLYHDNSKSWLVSDHSVILKMRLSPDGHISQDTISSRWVISNKANQATIIQCVLALHALHTELLHRHVIPSMVMGKTFREISSSESSLSPVEGSTV